MPLNHQELKLIKGLPKQAGLTLSDNEQIDIAIDLLTPTTLEGFHVSTDNFWTPKRPSLKSGGVWGESEIADGRELIAAAFGNVTERIQVVLRAASWQVYAARMRELERFRQAVQDAWSTRYQPEPCYIKWWALGAPGPQYALLYVMEIDERFGDYPDASAEAYSEISIILEREPFWRALAPGINPKEWMFQREGYIAGQDPYTWHNMSFYPAPGGNWNSSHNLIHEEVQNRTEWGNNFDTVTPAGVPLNKNWVDIPAEYIPGDAPALAMISIANTAGDIDPMGELYVGVSSKRGPLSDVNGVVQYDFLQFNAADSNAFAVGTKTADATCGVYSGAGLTRRKMTYTVAGSSTVEGVCDWYPSGNSQFGWWGSFAVFCRCMLTSGAAGDVQTRFRYENALGKDLIYTDWVDLPLRAGLGTRCDTTWDVLYLGRIKFPLDDARVRVATGGNGKVGGFPRFYIDVKNLNVANRNTAFLDVTLMPLDEGFACARSIATFQPLVNYINLDTTGYYGHGQVEMIAMGTGSGQGDMEYAGNPIFLKPGVDNRLYFLLRSYPYNVAQDGGFSNPNGTFDVAVNIIPRWTGIRDV